MDLLRVKDDAQILISYIVQKYGIRSYEGFTCPYTKELAKSLGFFDR